MTGASAEAAVYKRVIMFLFNDMLLVTDPQDDPATMEYVLHWGCSQCGRGVRGCNARPEQSHTRRRCYSIDS